MAEVQNLSDCAVDLGAEVDGIGIEGYGTSM
jgi:hypothetical protein